MSNEMNELFENLEEGILVMKNNTINYTNQIFANVLSNINALGNNGTITNKILDYKIFKLFETHQSDHAHQSQPNHQYYSLRDIINNTSNDFSGKIFEMVYKGKQCSIMKYVHFKMKKVMER